MPEPLSFFSLQRARSQPLRIRLFAIAIVLTTAFAAQWSYGLDPHRPLTQYVHDDWETDEGLPQGTVRAIAQTRDGYVWIGTEEGLARFDGVRFMRFTRREVPAFRSNHILALLEDRAGNLWVGTQGGGLMRYRDGAFTIYTRPTLPTDFVYALHEDREGTVWAGGRDGVTRVRGDTVAPWKPATPLQGTMWSILQDRAGVMWLGTDLYGLMRVERGTAEIYHGRDRIPHDAIPVVSQLRDGRIVIGTNGAGLFEWSDGRFIPFRAQGTLPSGAIHALFEDSNGNLWVGTSEGLARITNGLISTGAPEALGHSPIRAITEDHEGSLWIGTEVAGLHRLRNGKVRTMTKADGLPDDAIKTILHDTEGGTWISTDKGVAHLANGAIETFTTRNGLPSDSVRSLFQSRDGAIWLGTAEGGVAKWSNGRMQTITLDPDIPDNTVRAFAEDETGVWVGTNGGPLTLFLDGDLERRVTKPNPPRMFVRAMKTAKDGSLLVATDGNGLFRFVNGEFRDAINERSGLSRDGLRSLHVDPDGTLWIGTDGGGLNRVKNGKVTVYGTAQGLFDEVVLQILEGGDGRLWMSSNNGIFAVRRSDLDAFADGKIARVESRFIEEEDGMLSRDCFGGSQPAGARSADGRLWFPTNTGVVIVDPRALHTNTQAPPVHIEQVIADRTGLPTGATIAIPRGTKNLEITYTALSLVVPERVRFRYMLEGYDDQWIDAGTRRTAYYTALPPGRFQFRVIASNNDGVWNETGATTTLTIAPFFYQRRSFWVLAGALLLAAVWIFAAMRIRRVQREAARNAEMERRLVVAQKMDALGQMASGIAHDFNNALMSASPWADIILRQYPNDPMLQRSAQHIANAVERARRVTHQLLDFAQPRTPAIVTLDLNELVREELAMLRVVVPPEIEIETRLAATPVLATGDKTQIGQVLLNLLLNSRDATPNGGTITVETREPSAAEAKAWQVDRDAFVLVSVSDTGVGMKDDVREHIFEPFFTTKGVGRGTGLGLSVVHRIVHDHGGTVHVDSKPGEGTKFSVLLPKAVNAAASQDETATATAASSRERSLQVLLVDDEAVIREAIVSTLEAQQISVEVATTGPEALRLLSGGLEPDLIILDLGLPQIPGDRVFGLIRERLPEVPIIIASGYGDAERLEPLLREPKTAYLQKPYRMTALIEQITAMI